GAHGYVQGIRYSNHGPLKKYMEPLEADQRPILNSHDVPKKEQMEEEMFLGLRKTSGVSLGHFETKFGIGMETVYGEILKKEIDSGNLAIENGRVKLTKKGRFIGNNVFEQFLLA